MEAKVPQKRKFHGMKFHLTVAPEEQKFHGAKKVLEV